MRSLTFALGLALALACPAAAHLTPPVVLVSDRDAVVSLLSGAQRFFVREVRLSAQEQTAIKQSSGWTPDEDFYRFYVGRDEGGRMVGALVFVGDATIHGSVRVAVAHEHDRRCQVSRGGAGEGQRQGQYCGQGSHAGCSSISQSSYSAIRVMSV